MRKKFRHAILLLSFAALFSACQKEANNSNSSANTEPASAASLNNKGNHFGNISPEMVLRWNDAATYVVVRTLQLQAAPRIPPFRESHYYSMVNIAVHDALNNIVPKYKSYALDARDKDADPDAAVAKAAHDVISFFFGKLNPPANNTPQVIQDSIHNLLTQSLNSIPNGEAKTKGIALGAAAALAIIQNRTNDGSLTAVFPIVQGALAGEYRSTPPFEASGFYDSPGWGNVKPFSIQNSTQFPVPPPYSLNSPEYAADYNEVKTMGCATCTGAGGRTSDQEKIARFWVESSALGWNKVTKKIIAQKNMDAWKVARLLALVQISVADAYITCLKYKMNYFFWRPYTAIRLGDSDGNPNTIADPAWQVLVSPIPPITDHPSAHAAAGGAAAELLKSFFETDNMDFSFESSSLPGNPRSYSTFSEAARENSLSRIYVGYHFRKAVDDGQALGSNVGAWVATHSLQGN
ncbi:MAG TPA: vanadium-dependent haloperoxidase [Chitinophagaceae bacterium]|nr:vanadium-dependent haloperoxidase [Chitinophagaceae bacterium]